MNRFPFLAPVVSVDHVVIGAGVIGLAVAERLLRRFPESSVFVLERNGLVGQETSSRNSEVIHAGIYYPPDSLKTRLCIRGRKLLYARCEERGIPHRRVGKLLLATDTAQQTYLSDMLAKSRALDAQFGSGTTELIPLSAEETRAREPDVSPDVRGALLSPHTGIVSAHGLMDDLEQSIADNERGEIVCHTKFVRIDRKDRDWIIQSVTDGDPEPYALAAKAVVNCAGLGAADVYNMAAGEGPRVEMFYAKGSYFEYHGPGTEHVKHLLYPCPDPKTLAGLGTHLTMDLSAQIRFGPDIEWLKNPDWKSQLAVSENRKDLAVAAVQKYLPGVSGDGFAPGYAGIRPKLTRPGEAARDFSIEHSFPGFVNLMGIESPGLTSSLAIGEYVQEILAKEFWGSGRGTKVSPTGTLDDWC